MRRGGVQLLTGFRFYCFVCGPWAMQLGKADVDEIRRKAWRAEVQTLKS